MMNAETLRLRTLAAACVTCLILVSCKATTEKAGTSCTVVSNGDHTSTIRCPDGTHVTVSDGAAGTSCSIADNGDGTKTISCADGTVVTVGDGAPGSNKIGVADLHGLEFLLSRPAALEARTLAQLEITGASAAADGHAQVDFTVHDAEGVPVLALDGAAAAIARLAPPPTGEASTRWIPYGWRVETVSGDAFPRPAGSQRAAGGPGRRRRAREPRRRLVHLPPFARPPHRGAGGHPGRLRAQPAPSRGARGPTRGRRERRHVRVRPRRFPAGRGPRPGLHGGVPRLPRARVAVARRRRARRRWVRDLPCPRRGRCAGGRVARPEGDDSQDPHGRTAPFGRGTGRGPVGDGRQRHLRAVGRGRSPAHVVEVQLPGSRRELREVPRRRARRRPARVGARPRRVRLVPRRRGPRLRGQPPRRCAGLRRQLRPVPRAERRHRPRHRGAPVVDQGSQERPRVRARPLAVAARERPVLHGDRGADGHARPEAERRRVRRPPPSAWVGPGVHPDRKPGRLPGRRGRQVRDDQLLRPRPARRAEPGPDDEGARAGSRELDRTVHLRGAHERHRDPRPGRRRLPERRVGDPDSRHGDGVDPGCHLHLRRARDAPQRKHAVRRPRHRVHPERPSRAPQPKSRARLLESGSRQGT